MLISCSKSTHNQVQYKMVKGYVVTNGKSTPIDKIYSTYDIGNAYYESAIWILTNTAKGVVGVYGKDLVNQVMLKGVSSLPKSIANDLLKNAKDNQKVRELISEKISDAIKNRLTVGIDELDIKTVLEKQANLDQVAFEAALKNRNGTERANLYQRALQEGLNNLQSLSELSESQIAAGHLRFTLQIADVLDHLVYDYNRNNQSVSKTIEGLKKDISELKAMYGNLTPEQKNELYKETFKYDDLIYNSTKSAGEVARNIASFNDKKISSDENPVVFEKKINEAKNLEERKFWQDKWQQKVNENFPGVREFARNAQIAAETAGSIQNFLNTNCKLNPKTQEKVNKTVQGLTAISQLASAYASGNPADLINGMTNLVGVFSKHNKVDPAEIRQQELLEQFKQVFAALDEIYKLQQQTYQLVMDFWKDSTAQFNDVKDQLQVIQGNDSVILDSISGNGQLFQQLSSCKTVLRARIDCNEDELKPASFNRCMKKHSNSTNLLKKKFVFDKENIYSSKIITGNFENKIDAYNFITSGKNIINLNNCIQGLKIVMSSDINPNILVAAQTDDYKTGYQSVIKDVYQPMINNLFRDEKSIPLFYFLMNPIQQHKKFSTAHHHFNKMYDLKISLRPEKVDELVTFEDVVNETKNLISPQSFLVYSTYFLEIKRMLTYFTEEELLKLNVNYSDEEFQDILYQIVKRTNVATLQQNILSGEPLYMDIQNTFSPIQYRIIEKNSVADKDQLNKRFEYFKLLSSPKVISNEFPIAKNAIFYKLKNILNNMAVPLGMDKVGYFSDLSKVQQNSQSYNLESIYNKAINFGIELGQDPKKRCWDKTENKILNNKIVLNESQFACNLLQILISDFDSSLQPKIIKYEYRNNEKTYIKYYVNVTFTPENNNVITLNLELPSLKDLQTIDDTFHTYNLLELRKFKEHLFFEVLKNEELYKKVYIENPYIF